MIKDIIVNLGLGKSHDVAGNFALSVGQAFDAHVAGAAFVYDPTVPLVTVDGGVLAGYIDEVRQKAQDEAKEAAARFDAAARRMGVSAEVRTLDAMFSDAGDSFGAIASAFDLAVIAQPEPNKVAPEDLIIEGALFGSGRPVVVVPYIQKAVLKLDRVTVCWDGSRSSARAIADALPFLHKSKSVDLLMVDDGHNQRDEIPGTDMAQHLARKGLKIELKRLTSQDIDVGNTILSYAADNSSDFIVMGGYGHSRLREFVFGGVTRTMLESMSVPTLMSH